MSSPPDNTGKGPIASISNRLNHIDNWFQSHLDLVAFMALAGGLLIRVVVARKSYLNPDEALDYVLVNQASSFAAYQASLTNAHPPLYYMVLYFWRFLGNSEFILRLPSMLAGTAFSWIAFRWLANAFSRTAALIGLLLLTFSPAMIALSAEVRPYAFLLLFMASALYWLERALQENSISTMLIFVLFLYLAILTHYSALWFTLALGIYSCLRIISVRLKSSLIRVWVASQAGAVALYAWLDVTHISKLRGSSMEQEAWRHLHSLLFHSDKDSLPLFTLRNTLGVFQYTFAHKEVGMAMFVLFFLGAGFLLAKRDQPELRKPSSRELGTLLLLPFVIGCGGAIGGLYPYGGTRHNVYLNLFAIAGISALLAHLPGRKGWLGLLAAVVIVTVCNADPRATEFFLPENQSRILMSQVVDYIHQSVPAGRLIFVDYETSLMLRYYLCKEQSFFPADPPDTAFLEFRCGGYRVLSTGRNLYQFAVQDFAAEFNGMASVSRLKPGEHTWVAHIGWGEHLDKELTMRFPPLNLLPHQNFGQNISVFQVDSAALSSTPARADTN